MKPAGLGSSIGITRVTDPAGLAGAIDQALAHDPVALVEEGLDGARELECGVLGGYAAEASVVGEVTVSGGWFDYRQKYLATVDPMTVPARLPVTVSDRVRSASLRAFEAIGGWGLARVDFLYDERTDRLVVNELNTMPGFTAHSMYPKVWAALGVPYAELLDRLILLALERRRRAADRGRPTDRPPTAKGRPMNDDPEITLLSDPRIAGIEVSDNGDPLVDARDELRFDIRLADPQGHYGHLRRSVVQRLLEAEALLPKGFQLLVIEGYRPAALQRAYFQDYLRQLSAAYPSWDAERCRREASKFVAPPEVAPHLTGGAVDLTLCHDNGVELDLGTAVNDSPEASRGACFTASRAISPQALWGRRELTRRAHLGRSGQLPDRVVALVVRRPLLGRLRGPAPHAVRPGRAVQRQGCRVSRSIHLATILAPTLLLSAVLLPATWVLARAIGGRPLAALAASGSLVGVVDVTVMRPGLLHRYSDWSGVAAACQLTDPGAMTRDAVLNVVLLVPFGLFAVLALRGTIPALLAVTTVVLAATTISVVVEATQAAYRIGACDSSDVVHNTVGAALGALLGACSARAALLPHGR